MNKYSLLLILNLPFIFFGLYKAAALYRTKKIGRFNLLVRIGFWVTVLILLIFAEQLYEYLYQQGLTDSTPLSLVDVVLITGLLASLTLILRLYSRIDRLENRVTALHEEISIYFSLKP